MNALLEEWSNEISQRSPIIIVNESSAGRYLYVSPQDLETAWVNDDEDAETMAEPAPIQERALRPFSVQILSGGERPLTREILMPHRSQLLSRALALIGARGLGLARQLPEMEVVALNSAVQLEDALEALSTGEYPGAMIMCSPGTLSEIRRRFLAGRVSYRQTGMSSTNNLIDGYHPVFTPLVQGHEVVVYNRSDSLVLQGPRLFVRDNRLHLDFKLDICAPNNVRMFGIA